MLTQQDLKAIGQLIDKKVATDIAAIQARLADLEIGRLTKIDLIDLKSTLNRVEKRVTAIEGRMNRVEQRLADTSTKSDLKKIATKRSQKMMENRLIRSINDAVDIFDNKINNHEKRIISLENRSPAAIM